MLPASDEPVERPDNLAIGPEPSSLWARPQPPERDNLVMFAVVTAGLAAVTTVGLIGFEYLTLSDVTLADLAMLYCVLIMLAALVGRRVVIAVPLAVVAMNFLFMPPHFSLGIQDPHTLATECIMLGAGLAIGALTIVLRQKERLARAREQRTAAMLAFTRDVAAASDIPEIAAAAVRHVEVILGATAVVLTRLGDRLTPVAGSLTLTSDELAVAQMSLERGVPTGHGTTTLAQAGMTALPLRTGDEVLGVLVVGRTGDARGMDLEQRHLIDALARQTGFAIGRARLAVEARDASLRARTEELRSSLLSAVSHDLRTPLSVITGAATSLLDGVALDGPEARTVLLQTIVREACRLERVLQNLLAITRVETGLQPVREWIPVEELCGTALVRLAVVIGARRVEHDIPVDLLVPVDPVLFEHVLINLIENAVKHGTPPIAIAARKLGDRVEISVWDHGAGIPPNCEMHVFEKFFRAPGTRVPGVGLGLAVCRGIVEAHGGTIAADNSPAGGARFRVVLPADGAPSPAPTETA